MKKFRFLLVLALIIAMVSSFAMAANTDIVALKDVDGTNISYTSGNLTLSFVTTEACYADCPMIELVYDSTKWTPTSISTDITSASQTLLNTNVSGQTCSNVGLMDGYNFAQGANVITVTYEPVADANVIGSTFAISTDWYDYDTGEINYKTKRTYTVTAAQTETTATVNAAKAEYTNVQGKSGDNIFGVWVGTYNVTAGDAAKAIKKVSVAFTGDADNHAFVVDKDHEGNDLEIRGAGTTTFKIAIVGVPKDLANASVATLTIQ